MPLEKKEQLEQIRVDIEKNNVCPDLAKTAKHLVFGYGNVNAEILIIGEAPGKKEDETGMPFVGASGRLLDEMLSSISLNREDVYITNIVKYRPPNNRDPLQSEKDQFLPYLKQQIATIAPLLVITLGRHSMQCFLPNAIIGEAHGLLFRVKQENILPLYHPAAGIYNRTLRETMKKDFEKIPEILALIRKEK